MLVDMKRKIMIVLAGTVTLCAVILFAVGSFLCANIWKYCAKFEPYENEFILIQNYVENYMNGRDGVLLLSRDGAYYYDLYDPENRQYLNCPNDVRKALTVVSQKAFEHKDSHFDWIYCDENEVSFHVESGPYKLTYSPNKEPTMRTYLDSYIVLKRRITKDWYHVIIWPE